MGIEYYLVNKRKKELFDLGKGEWYTMFPISYKYIIQIKPDIQRIAELISSVMTYLEDKVEFEKGTITDWSILIAKRLIAWAEDDLVLFCNDSQGFPDEFYERDIREWPITADRYNPIYVENYREPDFGKGLSRFEIAKRA